MINVGDTYELDLSFTQSQVDAFAEITGDKNPIHIDAQYAVNTPFKRPVVHGFLSAAVFSRVFGTLFPGEGTIYLYQDMKFMAPVFVDQAYKSKFEVMEVDPRKHIGIIKCILEEENGKVCIEGTAKVMHKTQFVSNQ